MTDQVHIDELAEVIYNGNRLKGFYDDAPVGSLSLAMGYQELPEEWKANHRIYLGNKLMLVVGELVEAHESIRKNDNAFTGKSEHIPAFSPVEEEIADAIIRLLDFAGYNKLRLEQAIKAKLIYNQSRPYKHGKKF